MLYPFQPFDTDSFVLADLYVLFLLLLARLRSAACHVICLPMFGATACILKYLFLCICRMHFTACLFHLPRDWGCLFQVLKAEPSLQAFKKLLGKDFHSLWKGYALKSLQCDIKWQQNCFVLSALACGLMGFHNGFLMKYSSPRFD